MKFTNRPRLLRRSLEAKGRRPRSLKGEGGLDNNRRTPAAEPVTILVGHTQLAIVSVIDSNGLRHDVCKRHIVSALRNCNIKYDIAAIILSAGTSQVPPGFHGELVKL